jgi:surface carbohydrate biosynthesis protein
MRDTGLAGAPRVAMIVDHPQRDLPGLVLTAMDLASRGVVCHLVPLNLQEREVWALAPDFVLFNYLRRSNERFARNLDAAGIGFGALDTEGAIWPDPDEYAGLLWHDRALLRKARCVCMWGDRLAAHVIERRLFAPEQITVTGCPRFDLYAATWKHVIAGVASDDRVAARTVLINTNFSVSNPLFTTADKCVAMHRSVLGYADVTMEEVVAAEAAAIAEIVRIAQALADEFPAADVVIRPHPFENPGPYEHAASGRANLHVNQAQSIQAAIFGACAVIQRSCTTALEACLAGVPAISPQWIRPPFLMPEAEAASVPCESFDDLRRLIGRILEGSYRTPDDARRRSAEVVRECFFAADGLAHRRVGDAVYRALRPAARIDRRRCRLALYGLEPRTDAGLPRAARCVRHRLGLSPEWSFSRLRSVPATAWLNSTKHFDAASVRHIVDGARRRFDAARRESGEVVVLPARATSSSRGNDARYGVTIGLDRSRELPRPATQA